MPCEAYKTRKWGERFCLAVGASPRYQHQSRNLFSWMRHERKGDGLIVSGYSSPKTDRRLVFRRNGDLMCRIIASVGGPRCGVFEVYNNSRVGCGDVERLSWPYSD